MGQIKTKIRMDNLLDKVVLMALIAQIGFILCMNIFRADTVIDYDSSSAYFHEIEMGSQGKIFPSEYIYQGSLDLDSAAMISALLYHFTGDIFLSRGIANNLVILLYIYVTNYILSNLGLSKRWKRFGMLIFFIPYSMIMLGYWRILFVAAGLFALRAMVPLLTISLVLDFEAKKELKKSLPRLILLLFITFLTGLSSGEYVFLSAICPFIFWEFVRAFLKGDFKEVKSKRSSLAIALVIAWICGFILQKLKGLSTLADRKYILTSGKWIDAITSGFAGIFELFGGLTIHENVKLFSAEAIGTGVNFLVTWIIIFAIIYTVVKCIKNREISDMKGYIFSLLLVDFAMCSFVDLHYGDTAFESRYHLVPMLPAFFFIPMMMEELQNSKKLKELQTKTLQVVIVGLYLLSMLYGDAQWVYAKTALGTEALEEINGILEDDGIKTAFIVGDDSKVFGRKLRVYSQDTHYIVLSDGAESAWQTTFGGTTRYLDNSMQEGKVAVLVSETAYKTLPDYLVSNLEYVMDFEGLQVYYADESKFDCVGGLVVQRDRVIDFPYSPGYTYKNAKIDEDGVLVMKAGGGTLEGVCDSVEGRWQYTISYDMSQSIGDSCAQIIIDNEVVAKVDLEKTADSVTTGQIDMVDGQKVELRIDASEGVEIKEIVCENTSVR